MRKAEAVQPKLAVDQQLAQIIRIGTETVLSQFPIHKLSKGKEPLEIQFTKRDQRGKVTTIWKVSPSRDYGEPGILAYRIDTLIINRLIDQARPDVPEVIRLGSLRDICEQLGITEGKNTKLIKEALYQNAFAGITAKLEYNGRDKQRRTFEFGSTRYSVVFTGERLPDGRRADAVYVILNPLFREVLRYANTRPLDYNYLRSLKPSTQRLYELIAPQVFAAIKRGNGRAKYYYSDFCKYAPLTRFFEWDQVRPQMHRIHKEHLASGYVSKVDFEVTRDEQDRIDWVMLYTPGKRAYAEFEAFNRDREDCDRAPERSVPRLLTPSEGDLNEKERSLFDQLREHGVREDLAYRLVTDDQSEVEKQLDAFPNRRLDGIDNPAGLLIASIRNKYPVPQPIRDAEAKAQARRRAEAKAKRREDVRQELHREFAPEYLNTYLRPIRDGLKEINVEAFEAYQARCERMDEFFLSADADQQELWSLWDLEEMSKSWPELEILTFWDWMKESHPDLLIGLNG